MARVPPEEQFTSSITLGELVYGAHRLRKRTAILMEKIEAALLPNLPVLAFDTAAARRYGEIRAELERMGTPIGDAAHSAISSATYGCSQSWRKLGIKL